MAKLGEVCLLKAGKFVSANDISPEYNKGLYPCFGGNGIRGYVADYTRDGEFPLIGRQGALCGNVNLASGKFHATEHAVVVQPKIEMNVHWLYYALNAMNLGQYATGAAQPGLAVSKLETLSIEIPNISEQNKIAQTLCKVEQLVNFRKQQLAKLDELVKARFVEMFGDPADNVNNLPASPMTAICQIIDGDRGKNYPKQEEFSDSGFCLFLNAKNVTAQGFSFENCTYITEEKDTLLRNGKLCRGDVVLTTRGTIGNLAFYDTSVPYENIRINSGMVILRMNKQVVSEIFFIEQFKMQLDSIKSRIASGSAQPQLPISTMNKIEMILPPIELQKQFAAFVERVDQQKQTVQQSFEKLELMKKALMQEYFG